MSTEIDLSRIPAPSAIGPLDHAALLAGFVGRFEEYWAEARADDASLPQFDVGMLKTDPAMIAGRTWTFDRLLDRARVNDAIKALLAPLSTGTNLDNLVASQNVIRLEITPADGDTPAVMENDLQLLRRYLLSFEARAAGSAGRYLFDAYTAWPGMLHCKVNGYAVHGRRGDTDLVMFGPDGVAPTDEQRLAVMTVVAHVDRAPEGIALTGVAASRAEYDVDLTIDVPGIGPAPSVIQAEAEARIRAAAKARLLIEGEVPAGLLAGAAYGENVLAVKDNAPVLIAPDPYAVPVPMNVSIQVVVRP